MESDTSERSPDCVKGGRMKYLPVAALLALAPLLAQDREADANVNERYTVESVEVTGIDQSKLKPEVRDEINGLVGEKFSQQKLDEICRLIHHALPERTVSVKVSRGDQPEHVKVVFEVGGHEQSFDLAAPSLLYQSREGATAEVDATVKVQTSSFTFGVLDNGDSLVERYAGLRARFENRKIGTDRLRLAFEFDSFHTMWNAATREGIDDTPFLYRTRQNFEPVATFVIARPLTLSFGMSSNDFSHSFRPRTPRPPMPLSPLCAMIGTWGSRVPIHTGWRQDTACAWPPDPLPAITSTPAIPSSSTTPSGVARTTFRPISRPV